MPKNTYDESDIQSLKSLEHIRLRPGMYIGKTGNGSQYEDGIYILLKEVIDNAVDEFIMGYGKRVDITLNYDLGEVSIRDYGRGIPLGKVIDCVSIINTGGKFNDDVFQFSVGMNGVGTKAVNALSTIFEVRSYREGKCAFGIFERGELKKQGIVAADKEERNGTFIRFIPDDSIFKKFQFHEELVLRRMRMYAYLNAGLTLNINGTKIVSENGLLDLINDEAKFAKIYQPFYYRSKQLEFVFTHTNRFNEDYFSFVNGQFTHDGGTHLSAFKEGVLKAINEYANKKYDGDDVREGIIGAIAIRLKDPVFESQTKNKLGNQEIRSDLVNEIRKVLLEMLHRNPDEAAKLVAKIDETSKLHSELATVKKLARERSKTVSVRVPQLKDCKEHLNLKKGTGLGTMIFLTEGLSASGTINKCRDPMTQAVFSLRGKPLNTCNLARDALYKNQEFFNLMKSLDIEEDVARLRYDKIIFATDADVDGLHIRNLLITLFLRFFDSIIRDGHVFILETPLFRVRSKKNSKDSRYCYTEEEREEAIRHYGANAQITRFKGLGEISPGEFRHFIDENIRLTPVSLDSDTSIGKTLEFYMGSNTPSRREYIMNNLVITEESTHE
ncbi:MAG: type IIA DNA topoisomerase subunit B [Kiritimatiellae bacterium]|nr:type IIA DNA topoisomerase subunit B [Kiritimatiellia bacterium]